MNPWPISFRSKILKFFLERHLIIPNLLSGPENDYNRIPTWDSYKGWKCVYRITYAMLEIRVHELAEIVNRKCKLFILWASFNVELFYVSQNKITKWTDDF